MSPVDPSLLDRDMAVIRERRGADAIHWGHEEPPVERIPLTSPSLMRISSDREGHGGIPIGRVTRLWGSSGSGKSHVSWMIIRAAQELVTERFPSGLLCCYWNIEKQYDRVHTAALGVDTEKLLIQETTITEDVGRELELLLGSRHLHVLDSASFAVSQDELNSDTGDWHRGLDARVWKKVINRVHNRMDRHENVVVLIDHAGTNQLTHTEHALGGARMEFRSDLSIHFVQGSWLFYDDDGRLEKGDKIKDKSKNGLGPVGMKEADGIEVVVRVNKARVCRPFRSARMRLDLNTFRFDRTFD